jgi:hypothetical protein
LASTANQEILQTPADALVVVLGESRLSAAEWLFALTSFAAKAALIWLLELAFCEWDPERRVCDLVEKGSLPCLIT